MTGRELIDVVLERMPPYYRAKLGKPARHIVQFILTEAFEAIKDAACSGESTTIPNFAVIEPYERAGRRVYCGFTGEHTKSKDHVSIRIRVSKAWKAALNAVRNGG